ncbi:hypothetical protein [Aquisediminimonas sediminicola]|uniref:hypothetical protein n=1 Tax=Alteraquisediminimonas sediminicola TaxID=2676787 RepID=UPI001C8EFD60|nr:hypothetical protein [Aquisediminimonas sediminicola]
MIQTAETQLQVAQRALSETVLPALGGAEKHVIEQLQLTMAALAFMQQRLPYVRRYYRHLLRSYLDMADAMIDVLQSHGQVAPDELATLCEMGRAALHNPEAEDADYQHITAALRSAIAGLSVAAQGTDHEAALDAIIIELSGPILLNDRMWCIPLGFELRPQDLPIPSWMGR